MNTNKWICTERRCDWKGEKESLLQASNPFDTDDIIVGCPQCKQIDTIVRACDVDGCWSEVTSGFNTPEGYRTTCHTHYMETHK